jgi:uncharacterized protein
MKPVVLLDTGPLVAYVRARDPEHPWAVEQINQIEPPLFTCEAVITEAFYLLRHVPGGIALLIDLLSRGSIVVHFALMDHFGGVAKLIERYENLPMSLADACLVRMAELNPNATILTLDRHFTIYRKNNRQVIPTIMHRD